MTYEALNPVLQAAFWLATLLPYAAWWAGDWVGRWIINKKTMKKKDLIPNGGTTYNEVREAAQKIADSCGQSVNLWFNVKKGEKPETVKPKNK